MPADFLLIPWLSAVRGIVRHMRTGGTMLQRPRNRRCPRLHALLLSGMLLGQSVALARAQEQVHAPTHPAVVPAQEIRSRTDAVPHSLQDWIPWAMQGHEMLACPSQHDQADQRSCVWPERLSLVLDGQQAHFEQVVTVYGAAAAVPLPGEAGSWPLDVHDQQGQAMAVTGDQHHPQTWLSPGPHVLKGTLRWSHPPEQVRIPAQVGILSVVANGQPISPMVDADEHLWLQGHHPSQATPDNGNRLTLTIRRLIDDAIPRHLTTHYTLDVAGQPRQTELPAALLADTVALALRSDLPARLHPDGRLQVLLRPGHWTLDVEARQMQPVAALTLPKQVPGAEVWSYIGHHDLHVAQLNGASAVDAQQALVPDAWKHLPAYLVEPGGTLKITYTTQGNAHPAANRLQLERQWWLDFDGHGVTQKDVLRGTLSVPSRLQLQGPAHLGYARAEKETLPINILETEEPLRPHGHDHGQDTAARPSPGVELRDQALSLTTLSRLDNIATTMPANGWNTILNEAAITLQLPPGWTLLSASGIDSIFPPSWTSRWRLYDFFFMLLISLAAFRLLRPLPALIVALASLLSWYDLEPAGLTLIALLVLLAGWQAAPPTSAPRRWCHTGNRILCLVLLIILLPFGVYEARLLTYPSLEHEQAVQVDMSSLFGQTTSDKPKQSATGPRNAAVSTSLNSIDAIAPSLTQASDSQPEGQAASRRPVTVQTGPGEPVWAWNHYTMIVNGDIEPDQTLQLHILPPWATQLLRVLRLLVLFGSLWVMYRALPRGTRPPSPEPQPAQNTATVTTWLVGAALVAALCSSSLPVQAAESAPTDQTDKLQNIRDHLYPPPPCMPDCATLARMRVQGDRHHLTLDLLVNTQATVQIPLPAVDSGNNWYPAQVLLDGSPAITRRDPNVSQQGQHTLWALVPAGVHHLQLQGDPGQGDHVQLSLPMTPRMLEKESTVWNMTGLTAQGLPEDGVLHLSREKTHQGGDSQQLTHVPDALPGFAQVSRTLLMHEHWQVNTQITRLSASQAPLRVRFALLPGESVNDARVTQHDGFAEMDLGQAHSVTLSSTMPASAQLTWTALAMPNQMETWAIRHDSTWHLKWSGLSPVSYLDHGQLAPRWQPWPGEHLSVVAEQPVTVAGPTLTLEGEQNVLRPGAHSTEIDTRLMLRASVAGQQTATLPDGATLLDLHLDNNSIPARVQHGQLELPVIPGEHTLTVRWRMPVGTDGPIDRYEAARLSVNLPGVNDTTQILLPESRVVLLVGGSGIGPAVRFWGLFILLVGLALCLRRIHRMPLGGISWLLLLLGVAPVSLSLALLVTGWFFALASLPDSPHAPDSIWRRSAVYQTLQIILVIWSVLAAFSLYYTVQHSLLGYPDLLVGGNQSSADTLNWYQDHFLHNPSGVWVITMSLGAYRIMMLGWSLWLAFSLLGWIRWGWRRLLASDLLPLPKRRPPGSGPEKSGGGEDADHPIADGQGRHVQATPAVPTVTPAAQPDTAAETTPPPQQPKRSSGMGMMILCILIFIISCLIMSSNLWRHIL